MTAKDTAAKILDAAEELFSEKGFAETSLRNITTKAGVNLAAVNYHFGSKKSLIHAVFSRYLNPFCVQFDQEIKSLSPQQKNLDYLLKLIVITMNRSGLEDTRKFGLFMRLLGLAYTQGQGHLRKYLQAEYGEVFSRYMVEVNKVTPELNDEQRFWRIHFMLGAAVFTMSSVDSLMAMADHDLEAKTEIKDVTSQLMTFLASGMTAKGNQ